MSVVGSNILVWALLSAAPVFCQSITIDAGAPSDESPKYYTCASVCARYDVTLLPNATGDLTLRFGSFTYQIPTLPGLFKVSLYMRETGTVTGNGQRKFTVRLNGQAVPSLTNFDLFAVANITELQRDLIAISNGEITLEFITVLRSAVVSRIEVSPLSQGPVVFPIQISEVISLSSVIPDSQQFINHTLAKTPVLGGQLVAILQSSNIGGDRIIARPVDAVKPKELEFQLPLYRPFNGDTIQVLYWTLE